MANCMELRRALTLTATPCLGDRSEETPSNSEGIREISQPEGNPLMGLDKSDEFEVTEILTPLTHIGSLKEKPDTRERQKDTASYETVPRMLLAHRLEGLSLISFATHSLLEGSAYVSPIYTPDNEEITNAK